MTRYSDPNEFRTGSRADETNRFVAASRAALLWERAWPALWPASGIAGVFIVLRAVRSVRTAALDPARADPWRHHHRASACRLYFGFRNFHVPTWIDGARRLERERDLRTGRSPNIPTRMAAGRGDPLAEELWKLHMTQQLAGIGKLRLGWPSPGLAQRDPRALRYISCLLLLARHSVVAGADSAAGCGPRSTTPARRAGDGRRLDRSAALYGTGAGLSHPRECILPCRRARR